MIDTGISVLIAIIIPFFLYMVDRIEKIANSLLIVNHSSEETVKMLQYIKKYLEKK